MEPQVNFEKWMEWGDNVDQSPKVSNNFFIATQNVSANFQLGLMDLMESLNLYKMNLGI